MTYARGIKPLSIATVVATVVAFSLVFFYAPVDADQGFIQKIFYVHVPMAIVALCGFVAGGIMAIKHLRSRDASWDMRSYVAIHMSIILGLGVLVTGAIWAKASWGHWWVWDEPVLVSFLVVFLLYCVYYPLRYSIEDPERQARASSVFAIAAGAFVPINFMAVRAGRDLHPPARALPDRRQPARRDAADLPGLPAGHGPAVRDAVEARADRQAGLDEPQAPPRSNRGLMPALPLDEAGKYVAAAYIVFLALVLIYVAIIGAKIARISREIEEMVNEE